MIIENTRFGAIEVEDGKIIRMIHNMPGFPGRSRFVILNREESRPFLWYQSVEEPALAFVIISPYLFKPDYRFDPEGAIAELGWEKADKEKLAVFAVVNASGKSPDKVTANLMAPLVVNMNRWEAVQWIAQDSAYPHNHPLFTAS